MKTVHVLYFDSTEIGVGIVKAFETRKQALEYLISKGEYLGESDPDSGFAYYLDEVPFEEAVK